MMHVVSRSRAYFMFAWLNLCFSANFFCAIDLCFLIIFCLAFSVCKSVEHGNNETQ